MCTSVTFLVEHQVGLLAQSLLLAALGHAGIIHAEPSVVGRLNPWTDGRADTIWVLGVSIVGTGREVDTLGADDYTAVLRHWHTLTKAM